MRRLDRGGSVRTPPRETPRVNRITRPETNPGGYRNNFLGVDPDSLDGNAKRAPTARPATLDDFVLSPG